MGWGDPLWLAGAGLRELALFAAVGFLIGGLDELAIDLIWGARWMWRRAAVYSRYPRADLASLSPPRAPGRIVVFVPAWDEAAVIGRMLETAIARFGAGDYRLYVGCYPNDPATQSVVAHAAERDGRVRPGRLHAIRADHEGGLPQPSLRHYVANAPRRLHPLALAMANAHTRGARRD